MASALAHKLSNRVVVMIAGTMISAAICAISLAKELWHINLIMILCGKLVDFELNGSIIN